MQSSNQPFQKDIVLIGGGHSHVIALKLLGIKPLGGVRLILISETDYTPYSGMLPGYVAGFYSFEETHIHLPSLARFAQAQFIQDQAIALDLEKNQVICANHPPISFDYLSLDIGSTPATVAVTGATEYTIAAKPVPQFLQAWNKIIQQVKKAPHHPVTLSIVGGGAGGVELALNMQAYLAQFTDQARWHLFHRGKQLLSSHRGWVSQRLETLLRDRGIQLHLQENVTKIIPCPNSINGCKEIICESGLKVESDHIFWVTQASAANWIKTCGLTTDSKGFILVRDTLQSVSHPHIFAAGDIATMENHPRPKAGVFAVRQGKPLFENLQRMVLGQPLKSYYPQKWYLSLIGTGDKKAIASWGLLSWESSLLWRCKDHIDRQFMRRFNTDGKKSN